MEAVDEAFDVDVDYAMLIKLYGEDLQDNTRCSPGACVVNTSYVERQNLTMRTQMRRSTRLTNAFSKKLANHVAAISLPLMHYNFVRIHQTLKTTPAIAAGVDTRIWTVADILSY